MYFIYVNFLFNSQIKKKSCLKFRFSALMIVIGTTLADTILYVLCSNIYIQYQKLAYKLKIIMNGSNETTNDLETNLELINDDTAMEKMVFIIKRHEILIQ